MWEAHEKHNSNKWWPIVIASSGAHVHYNNECYHDSTETY